MRQQGQQNRRGRGRPNHNRSSSSSSGGGGKGQNPLTRSYESNGPDVKIRGNPSHIAEKYISLARDSLSSGDIVMAENYLQHAEHYNRIIMAYREQTQAQNERGNANGQPRQVSQNQAGQSQEAGAASSTANTTASDAGEAGGNGRAPARRGRQRPQPRQQSGDRQQAGDRQQSGDRQPRAPRARAPRDADVAAGEAPPRAQSRPRRDSTDGDGSKITDGQDAPGFLRKPVAPTTRRRRKTPEADVAAPSESVAAKDEA